MEESERKGKTVNDFDIHRDSERICVALGGDLTVSVVPELKSGLQQALAEKTTEVEFDFQKTVVIDSTGIGFLIATYNSLTKVNGVVRVVRTSDDIFRLFQSMRLEKRLGVSKQ